jgi:DNA polymerase V
VQLPVASTDTGKLIKAAVTALAALYMLGYRYKEAGVILLDLLPAVAAQAGLFDLPDDVRSIARMRAIDNLNARTAAARSRWASPASAKSGGCGGIHIAALHNRLGCATAD